MISRLLIFSLIYFFFINPAYSKVVTTMPMAQSSCKNFMDDIVNNYSDKLTEESENIVYAPPFYIEKFWDNSKIYNQTYDKEKRVSKGSWTIKRDEKNNILIAAPAPPLFNPKFFSGDKIIEVDGKKISEMKDEELENIFDPGYEKKDIGKEFQIKIIRKNQIKMMNFKIDERRSYYYLLGIFLKDLKLNIQDSQITASIDLSVSGKFKNLKKFTHKHFASNDGIGCEYNDEEINIMQLPRLDDFIIILNSRVLDRDSLYRGHQIDSLMDEDNAQITSIEKKSIAVNQNFKLKSFPFDRQVISIQIIAEGTYAPYVSLDIDHYSEQNISKYIKDVNIPGWNVIGYNFVNRLYQPPTFFVDSYSPSLKLNIVVQRSYEFYIFKIIIPILLILMICWSVLWIDPKEIESRLTITIVCLLSLIAYNFVIEKDLPKLSYLTIMDYLILLSYIYAAIPNFLSIASFKLCKTNPTVGLKIENFGKRFGPLSYILLVLLTVLFAINNNPNTAQFLSGLI